MKEIVLADAPAPLADLVAEIERTGEPIVLTRDGRAAARLEPARTPPTAPARVAAARVLAVLGAEIAAAGAEGWPATWDDLKSWAEDGRG